MAILIVEIIFKSLYYLYYWFYYQPAPRFRAASAARKRVDWQSGVARRGGDAGWRLGPRGFTNDHPDADTHIMIPQHSIHEVLPRSEIADMRKYVDKVDNAHITKKDT